jgi:hypothetical protein
MTRINWSNIYTASIAGSIIMVAAAIRIMGAL